VKFKTIYEIFKIYEECEKKIDFKKKLEKIITEQLKKYLKNDENNSYNLENLQYGPDNRKIVHILILFNIYAYKNANSKIPFKLFARSWSLEHIHAQNTQNISEDSKFKVWKIEMENLLRELPDENKDLFDTLNKINNDKELIEEFEKELEFITGEFIEEDKMHSLSNLTLLSKELNSSLGNKVFFQKRKQIMEWEKVTNDDFFIPLATKNIFAKYYSENIEHVLKWSNTDKESYEKKLLECLSQYLVIEG
jgi:HD superfamily phosphohydrolase